MKNTKMFKKNYEFRRVLSKGKYYSGKYIEAFIQKNNKNFNFLGIAISVKIAKAVRRNKIKRLIRENYRIIENDINLGYDIVFLCKKKVDISDISFENVKEDIYFIFDKVGILKNKGNI